MKDLTAELEAVEQRLHTACLTVQCLPADGPQGVYSTWPRYKLDWFDAEEAGAHRTDAAVTRALIRPPKFYPTPRQVSDCLPALALLDGAPGLWRRIVSARAHQEWYCRDGGWRGIGADCGCSHKTARLKYWQAITLAWETQERQRAA